MPPVWGNVSLVKTTINDMYEKYYTELPFFNSNKVNIDSSAIEKKRIDSLYSLHIRMIPIFMFIIYNCEMFSYRFNW